MSRGARKTNIGGALALVVAALAAPRLSEASNHFIVPGGSGSLTGVDWNNALGDLPSAPICGDSYFIAGGGYNYTGTGGTGSEWKVWSASCTASAPVAFYKAVDCSATAATYCGSLKPQSVAGWQASYGTAQAVFYHTADADPENTYHQFITVCGSYYTIDGVSPASGGPIAGGQGIQFQSPNKIPGFIYINNAPGVCSGITEQTNITIAHVEFNGVNPQYGVAITACNRANGVVTVTLASAPPWVVGDKIDLQTVTPSDFNTGQSGYGVAITTISVNRLTFAQTGSNETCSALGYAVLNYSPGAALEIGNVSETFNEITVYGSYIHDIGGGAMLGVNIYTLNFYDNYVARDRSTYTQHENGLIVSNGGTFSGQMGPFSIYNNIWEDIEGTMVAGMLGTGTLNGMTFYNNLIFCTQAASAAIGPSGHGGVNSAASPQCGVSQVLSDNNGGNVILNAKLYGNTFANVTANPICGFHFGNANSTGDAQNNLFWNCYNNFALGNSATPGNFTNGYTTVLASDTSTHSISCGGGTTCGANGDYINGSAVDPFVNDADTAKNFRLVTNTIDPHLGDGNVLSSPFNLDIVGASRGASGIWSRGTYQMNVPVNPPTNLTVIPH